MIRVDYRVFFKLKKVLRGQKTVWRGNNMKLNIYYNNIGIYMKNKVEEDEFDTMSLMVCAT